MKNLIVFLFVVLFAEANQKLSHKISDFVPAALKNHLPANVLNNLNKLGSKDLLAAEHLASKWSEFKSVKQFEKNLLVESRPLKAFIDSAIKAGHENLDKTVDRFHPETIKMIKEVSFNREFVVESFDKY